MKATIVLYVDDLKEDIEQFVADVEHGGSVNSADNEEGTVVYVNQITVAYHPQPVQPMIFRKAGD